MLYSSNAARLSIHDGQFTKPDMSGHITNYCCHNVLLWQLLCQLPADVQALYKWHVMQVSSDNCNNTDGIAEHASHKCLS